MKVAHWIIAVAAIASVMPAHAGTTDPLNLVYVISGVLNNYGAATSVHCTNGSSVPENIQVVVRDRDGRLYTTASSTLTVPSGGTRTWSTQNTFLFLEDVVLFTSATPEILRSGVIGVLSTTPFMLCTAMIVDTTIVNPTTGGLGGSPVGISLHMLRFNPWPGTLE